MSKYGRVGIVANYKCGRCNEVKPLEMFDKTKETLRGRGSICKLCKAARYNVKSQMLANARKRATKKGLEFTLTSISIDRIIEEQGNKCAYSGLTLNWERSAPTKQRVCPPDRASLDRIDSQRGYTEDNVQLVTDFCNRIKTWYPDRDVYAFCRAVIENLDTAGPE